MIHIWEVRFVEGQYGYVEAANIVDAARKILHQDWNQDVRYVTEINLVENGFGPNTVDGWYSENKAR